MPAIRETTDLARIRALPRRRLDENDAAAWARFLTRELRLAGSTAELRPWQGFALYEATEHGGAFLGLPVGQGKTLLAELLPVVMGAVRPVLILPGQGGQGLREKTYAERAQILREWRGPRTPMRILTLSELAPERAAKLLETMQPDLIVIDESDELANPDSAAARRIDRYIVAHPEVRVVAMTGTPSRKSIMNYWHVLCWCLRDKAPVPLTHAEADTWAQALDHGSRRVPSRMSPGALGPTKEAARAWYLARLSETPGVILVDGDSCDAPLTIRTRLAREDSRLDAAYARFLTTLETPDGLPVSDPLSRWRIDGQLGCGLYLRYNPRPPDAWMNARRDVARFIRDRIQRSQRTARPLDTDAQVMRRFPDAPEVVAWDAVKGTFEPRTEAVWVSDSTIESVRDWLAESDAPGIVWSGCVEFGEALARATRLPYYGREGREWQSGRGLHAADPARSLIASWHANKRGFNLQPWKRALVVMPPQSAKFLEQIFGRVHRAGQNDHVTIDVLIASGGTRDAFEAAIAEATFAASTVGMTQKILRADIVRVEPRITKANHYRWARKGGASPAPIGAKPPRAFRSAPA